MLKTVTITSQDIFHTAKIFCRIPDLIENIVTRRIIEAAAEEAGIIITTEEIQKECDEFRLQNELLNADDTWKWLDKHSFSIDDFEEINSLNLLSNKLVQNLFADKIEPYFFQNQLDYAEVVMYEIVLEDEDLALELFYDYKYWINQHNNFINFYYNL